MQLIGRIFFLILIANLLWNCGAKKEIIPGTSFELAGERKETISNLQYALFFDIPASQKDSIKANVTIRFDLKNTTDILQLDFNAPDENIKKIKVNNVSIAIAHENEHILIDEKFLVEGANSINIE